MDATTQARFDLLRSRWTPAPYLPLPEGRPVHVANTPDLVEAITTAKPHDVILLADGDYSMPRDVQLTTNHVSIRGANGNAAKVVLDGSAEHMNIDTALLRIKRAHHVTIANLTFRNAKKYGLMFYGDASVHDLHLHNVHFHNLWARGLKGTHPEAPEDNRGNGNNPPEVIELVRPKRGRVEYCQFFADHIKTDRADQFDGDYIAGMDLMGLDHWRIANNLFFNLQGANHVGRGAIFIWVASNDLTIENNLFLDCDRSIALGNPSQSVTHNVDRARVRNNTILAGARHAIECCSTRDVVLEHNRIFATQLNKPTIEFVNTMKGGLGAKMEHNTIHGRLELDALVTQTANDLAPGPVDLSTLDAVAKHLPPATRVE